jgi:hypothetical protein
VLRKRQGKGSRLLDCTAPLGLDTKTDLESWMD